MESAPHMHTLDVYFPKESTEVNKMLLFIEFCCYDDFISIASLYELTQVNACVHMEISSSNGVILTTECCVLLEVERNNIDDNGAHIIIEFSRILNTFGVGSIRF